MRGKASDLATPLMISAIRIACSSLSMTHGPAIRKRSPDPTWMSPTWKEVVMPKPFHHLDEVEGNSRIRQCLRSENATAPRLAPADETSLLRRSLSRPAAFAHTRTLLPQTSE